VIHMLTLPWSCTWPGVQHWDQGPWSYSWQDCLIFLQLKGIINNESLILWKKSTTFHLWYIKSNSSLLKQIFVLMSIFISWLTNSSTGKFLNVEKVSNPVKIVFQSLEPPALLF
jgi:hypothetical protein